MTETRNFLDAYERDADGYIILTPKLAKVASQTLDDVATPAGSLGTIAKLRKGFAWVEVGNDLADDYGTTKHEISKLSVNPDTVEYWRRQGYLD